MASNEIPASLAIGTQVSAKYKGAFCEAKVKSVQKSVKCRVTFRQGLGSATLSDDYIRVNGEGPLTGGSSVTARHPDKLEYLEATVNKIHDQSQYTVVFDDGDITTLRRNALCMKSGKHYNASESLDNLPLTHPEHFSTPVSGSRRRKRGGANSSTSSLADNNSNVSNPESENEYESSSECEETISTSYLSNIGKVVWAESAGNKKSKCKDTWFPALIVAPSASDAVKINTKEEFLIRSFKDGRYYTVSKKDTNKFNRDSIKKSENMKEACEKAIAFIETQTLPPHWDKDILFSMGSNEESTTESSESEEIDEDEDDESREEKDHLVAELYKHMEDRGQPINRTPNIVGKDLDLYRLFRIVYKYGGHQRVSNNNKWRQVAVKLGFETTWCANQVRVNYKRYLLSFEEMYKTLGCTMKSTPVKSKSESNRSQIRGSKSRLFNNEETDIKIEITSNKESSLEDDVKKEATPPPQPAKETTKKKGGKTPKVKKVKEEEESLKARKEEMKMTTRPRRDSSSNCLADAMRVKAQKDEMISSSSNEKSNNNKKPVVRVDRDRETEIEAKKLNNNKTAEKENKIIAEDESSEKKEEKKTPKNVGRKKSDKKKTPSIHAEQRNNDDDSSSSGSSSVKDKDKEDKQHLAPEVDVRVGDKIRVFYIRDTIYDAKVIKTKVGNSKWPKYLVHYQGWNARYDEVITRSRIAENLSWSKDRLKSTPSTYNEEPEEKKEEKKEEKNKRVKSRAGTPTTNEKSKRTESPLSTTKRTRSIKPKVESESDDDDNSDNSRKSSRLNKKPPSTPEVVKSRRNRKRNIDETEDVEVEKDDDEVESPTKSKRGRKAKKEVEVVEEPPPQTPSKSDIENAPKENVSETTPSKKATPSRSTPTRSSRNQKNVKKEEEAEDPYAFKEPEPLEEVKYETKKTNESGDTAEEPQEVQKPTSEVLKEEEAEEEEEVIKDDNKKEDGKPVLQLTEKQKELFPFLSNIRTITAKPSLIPSVKEQVDKIEKISSETSPDNKSPEVPPPAPTPEKEVKVESKKQSSSNKKRKTRGTPSRKPIRSDELVIESDDETDSDEKEPPPPPPLNTTDKEPQPVSKKSPSPPPPPPPPPVTKTEKQITDEISTKPEAAPNKNKDEDIDDLACAETIPGSPVHPSSSSVVSSIPAATPPAVAETAPSKTPNTNSPSKLEMPFATVPESGHAPVATDVSLPSLSSIPVKSDIVDKTPTPPPSNSDGAKSPADSSDMDSISGRNKPESDDSRLDVEGSSSGEPTNVTTKRIAGTKRKEKNEAPRSPANNKRKRRTRESNTNRIRGGKGSGRDETDESEEHRDPTLASLGSLDNEALAALSQRSPRRSSKYNFYVDFDQTMDSSERISKLQNNLEELRKTYMNIKTELASIERRRKKIRRKERERTGASSGSDTNRKTVIEVAA